MGTNVANCGMGEGRLAGALMLVMPVADLECPDRGCTGKGAKSIARGTECLSRRNLCDV